MADAKDDLLIATYHFMHISERDKACRMIILDYLHVLGPKTKRDLGLARPCRRRRQVQRQAQCGPPDLQHAHARLVDQQSIDNAHWRIADEFGDESGVGILVQGPRSSDLLIKPAFITTITSETANASCWSWVT